MPNPVFLYSAQIVAILSFLLLAAGYLKTDPRESSAQVFALMALMIVLYLLNGMTAAHIDSQFQLDLTRWELIISIGISSIPGLFMIYCFLIFQEEQKFPYTLGIAFAAQIFLSALLPLSGLFSDPFLPVGSWIYISYSQAILQLIFVILAIYWTLKGWSADLVADRRILRWFFIGVQGALIFTVIFVENFLVDGGSTENATAQSFIVYAIALLTLGMLLVALRFDLVSLGYVIRKVAELSIEPEKEGTAIFDIDSFNKAFKEQLLYREAGLTISMLAKSLNIPEYRLRAFIHKQLGFRNFNAMLHHYRIEDSGNVLSDNENQNIPILTIALSVGYQSITPFNKAFREIKGVTPSEYRKRMTAR
jgi:AraC-like DNA-binding protein